MNKLSNEKRKVYQISLTRESELILATFTEKYGTSKSIVIERALQFLAAQYHRKIYLQYVLLDENNTTTTTTKEQSLYNKTEEEHIKKYSSGELENISDDEMKNIIASINKHKVN